MDDVMKILVSDDEDCSQVSKISTLVFMDLEATGLPSFIGKKNVHITEISLVAVDRTDFENDSSLRVLNKLSLCVRPRTAISPTAMSITGLYNDVLDNQEKFDESVPKLLEYFFRRLRRPLCLLAHNGKRYDFPLLQAELKHINYGLDPGILCADTLEAFRFISLNPTCDESFLNPPKEVPNASHNGKSTEISRISEDSGINGHVQKEIQNVSVNLKTTDHDLTILDKETDDLLSDSIDIFIDIEEPTIITNCKPKSMMPYLADIKPGHPSSSKLDPLLDERTPPKSKSQEDLLNPKPIKRVKQGIFNLTVLPKDHYKDNVSICFQNTQAKRQLFKDSDSKARPSRPVQFSLDKLYGYYFGEAPPQSHYAEADCIALSKVCQRVNKDFLKWIDENSKSFSETEAMW